MEYLVQEWIYRGVPNGVERHERYFSNENEANKFYDECEKHLRGVSETEKIFPSFVRMFKMKMSDLAKDGWGVDYCMRITEASHDKIGNLS